MRTVLFANSPPAIRPLGIGGIVIDPPTPTWINRTDFKKILDIAVDDLGIRYIDTAELYGVAEEIIGDWLSRRDRPRDLLIGSKTIGPSEAGAKFDSPFVLRSLQRSLDKLKLQSLDIYWMHAPHEGTPIADTAQALAEAVLSGKIKTYGLCNVSAEQVEKTLAHATRLRLPPPSAIQNEFNLLRQSEQAEVLNLCRQHGMSFVAFSPLASGMLAGRYQWNQPPPANSRWDLWSKRSRPFPPYWTEAGFVAVEHLTNLAKEWNTTSATLALAWMFQHTDIALTLLGPRVPSQLESSRLAMELELTPKRLETVRQIFHGF